MFVCTFVSPTHNLNICLYVFVYGSICINIFFRIVLKSMTSFTNNIIWRCHCSVIRACMFPVRESMTRSHIVRPYICICWCVQSKYGNWLDQFLDILDGKKSSSPIWLQIIYACLLLSTMQCLCLTWYRGDKAQAVRSVQAHTSLIPHRYPTNYAHHSPFCVLSVCEVRAIDIRS